MFTALSILYFGIIVFFLLRWTVDVFRIFENLNCKQQQKTKQTIWSPNKEHTHLFSMINSSLFLFLCMHIRIGEILIFTTSLCMINECEWMFSLKFRLWIGIHSLNKTIQSFFLLSYQHHIYVDHHARKTFWYVFLDKILRCLLLLMMLPFVCFSCYFCVYKMMI